VCCSVLCVGRRMLLTTSGWCFIAFAFFARAARACCALCSTWRAPMTHDARQHARAR
jgi:hypothetical protein